MKYWLIVLTPDSYDILCSRNVTMVGAKGRLPLTEKVSIDDKFIAYVSKVQRFEAIGSFASNVTQGFNNPKYPWERAITLHAKDLHKPIKDLFFGLEEFREVNTTPGNLLTLKGGLMEVSEKSFKWLKSELGK